MEGQSPGCIGRGVRQISWVCRFRMSNLRGGKSPDGECPAFCLGRPLPCAVGWECVLAMRTTCTWTTTNMVAVWARQSDIVEGYRRPHSPEKSRRESAESWFLWTVYRYACLTMCLQSAVKYRLHGRTAMRTLPTHASREVYLRYCGVELMKDRLS